MSFNPCCCWNLKDGCVTVGIWSLVFGLAQLGLFGWQSSTLSSCKSNIIAGPNQQCQTYCPCIATHESVAQSLLEAPFFQIYCVTQIGIFGWQTAAIKFYKDRAANTLLPAYAGTYDTYDQRFPGYYERYYQSTEEQFYTALFVVQILCLIAAFFLLFASVALIYGVHTNSRYLVWPWFPCMIACILGSLGYSITWWVGEVTSYWLVLTIIEVVTVIVNVYCLLAVIVQYRRIVSGVSEAKDPYYSAKGTRVYFDNGDYNVKPVMGTPAPFQYSQGELNAAYSPEQDYRQKQMPQVELNSYGQEPYHATLQHQAPPIVQKFPLQEEVPQAISHEFVHPAVPKISSGSQGNLTPWQEGVMLVPDAEPNTTGDELRAPKMAHAESAGDLLEAERRKRRRHRDEESRSHRRHRSSDARSRKSSRGDYDDDSDDEGKSRRSRRHKSSRSQSRSHSRDQPKYSDSDTGYSRSECSKAHRRRHRERDGDDAKSERSRSSRHKRNMRDVKREDAGRSRDEAPPLPPKYSPAPPYSGAPSPSGLSGPSGGITIPQHIVIPPTGKGKEGKPQRFHINSEITISYSDRSTPNPSDSDPGRLGGPPNPPPRPSRPVIEPLTSPAEDNDEEPGNISRGSNHGSTAV